MGGGTAEVAARAVREGGYMKACSAVARQVEPDGWQ
jgi:hypothetical protein